MIPTPTIGPILVHHIMTPQAVIYHFALLVNMIFSAGLSMLVIGVTFD